MWAMQIETVGNVLGADDSVYYYLYSTYVVCRSSGFVVSSCWYWVQNFRNGRCDRDIEIWNYSLTNSFRSVFTFLQTASAACSIKVLRSGSLQENCLNRLFLSLFRARGKRSKSKLSAMFWVLTTVFITICTVFTLFVEVLTPSCRLAGTEYRTLKNGWCDRAIMKLRLC